MFNKEFENDSCVFEILSKIALTEQKKVFAQGILEIVTDN